MVASGQTAFRQLICREGLGGPALMCQRNLRLLRRTAPAQVTGPSIPAGATSSLPYKKRTQPGAYHSICFRQCWHGRSRPLDQHLAQVTTAALCDPEQLRLPSVHRTIANHSD